MEYLVQGIIETGDVIAPLVDICDSFLGDGGCRDFLFVPGPCPGDICGCFGSHNFSCQNF